MVGWLHREEGRKVNPTAAMYSGRIGGDPALLIVAQLTATAETKMILVVHTMGGRNAVVAVTPRDFASFGTNYQ